MTKVIFGLPFDDDVFVRSWQEVPDVTRNAIVDSGVMMHDPLIANALKDDGNLFSIPFFMPLKGTPANYDGQTDVPFVEHSGDYLSGVAFGRTQGWTVRDFAADLSGADPMGNIVKKVARFWALYRQKTMLSILEGVFGVTGGANDKFKTHTVDISKKDTKAVKIEAGVLNDVAVDTLGDNKSAYKIAIMHSKVARTLEKQQLLEFWKYTDANGIERPLNIASAEGFTVIVDDSVPVNTTTPNFPQYTTYLLGEGVLRTAPGALSVPVETDRDPAKNGGMDRLITRIREAIHPNGFSFIVPKSGWTESPTLDQLKDPANWSLKYDDKAIAMARLITNG